MRRRMTYGRKFDADTLVLLHADGTMNDEAGMFTRDYGTPGYIAGKFGQAFRFDGSNYIRFSSLTAIPFNSSPITVETFIYLTTSPNCAIFSGGNNGSFEIMIGANAIYVNRSEIEEVAVFGYTSPIGSWFHLAVVKSGSNFKLYINGTSVGSVNKSVSFVQPTTYALGEHSMSGYYRAKGYIDEFRISKVARYTANFTPPTSSFKI